MDGYVTIGTELDTKGFDKEIVLLEDKLNDIKATLQMADEDKTLFSTREIKEMEAEAQKLGRRIDSLKEKQAKINAGGFANMKQSIESVGNSVEKTIKKVSRWALAVFGVRSAYMFVRQAMSTLSQYDEQMAVNIEWIRYLLASVLKPVIETIINLAYKLLTYINYIAQAWFGVNLFANASTKAFEKQHKALGGSVKQAKQLQKTLTGFDEMNVLQKNGDTSSGGGGGGVSLPSFPKMEDVPIPSWVKWIADNKDLILAILSGIATGLLAIKFGLKGIEALGIGIAIAGVVMLIKDIIKFIKDPSWQNFVNILGDIAIIIGGIMLVMGNWWGLLVVLVGLAVKLIANNWGAIKGILGTVGKWINNTIIKPVANFFKGLWDGIKNGAKAVVNFVKNVFSGIINFFKSIISSIVGLFKTVGKKVGDVIAGAFKGVINGVLGAIESILNAPIRAINGLIGVINKVPGINLGRLDTFNLPRLARGGIVNNPGPGVMMGSYIAGERGPEAVIPLDDQTLDRLGEAFARHTVINASITNTMNGRVLSRELQKVQNSSDFAFNR